MKQWCWQLSGWSVLTSMSFEERGVAVAMSLGGKAREIVQAIPIRILQRRDGLTYLLRVLEAEMGAELQDRQRAAGKSFKAFVRPRAMSAAEFVTTFERIYGEAVSHGLAMSRTMLSQELISKAQLTDQQELWVLQQCNADYNQYEIIRRSIKRIPALDQRHGPDASAWPIIDGDSTVPSTPAPSQKDYNPWASGGLNIPHDAPPPGLPSPSESDAQAWPAQEDEWWEADSDDYLSCQGDDNDVELATAFVIRRKVRVQKRHNKGGKGGGKTWRGRRIKSGKGGTWFENDTGEQIFVGQNVRNLDNEPPQGWSKEKWLARTPCPGCGSRFHRDCSNRQPKGKGHSKGYGSGKHSFGIFMTSMMAMASDVGGFIPISTPLQMQPSVTYRNNCFQRGNYVNLQSKNFFQIFLHMQIP